MERRGDERSISATGFCSSHSFVVFSPIRMSQTPCVTIIPSLFPAISKHTHTHTPDSCVWLGKCLWRPPLSLLHPQSHSPAPFLDSPLSPPAPASYCYRVHRNLPDAQLEKTQFCCERHAQLSQGPLRWPIWISNKQLFTLLCPLGRLGSNVRARICFLAHQLACSNKTAHCIKARSTWFLLEKL